MSQIPAMGHSHQGIVQMACPPNHLFLALHQTKGQQQQQRGSQRSPSGQCLVALEQWSPGQRDNEHALYLHCPRQHGSRALETWLGEEGTQVLAVFNFN